MSVGCIATSLLWRVVASEEYCNRHPCGTKERSTGNFAPHSLDTRLTGSDSIRSAIAGVPGCSKRTPLYSLWYIIPFFIQQTPDIALLYSIFQSIRKLLPHRSFRVSISFVFVCIFFSFFSYQDSTINQCFRIHIPIRFQEIFSAPFINSSESTERVLAFENERFSKLLFHL